MKPKYKIMARLIAAGFEEDAEKMQKQFEQEIKDELFFPFNCNVDADYDGHFNFTVDVNGRDLKKNNSGLSDAIDALDDKLYEIADLIASRFNLTEYHNRKTSHFGNSISFDYFYKK